MAHSKARRRWRLLLFLILGLSLTTLAFFGIAAALRTNKDIDPAKLTSVERGKLARSVVATGKIEPLKKIEVKSKASGIVKKIFIDYGEYVKQGQVLVELDKEELSARQREAQAALQAAEAAREAARAIHARNEVEANGPDLPFLKASMERAGKLHQQGLLSKALAEESEKNYQLALNKQQTSLRNLAVSRAEVTRTEAQIAQAQAALDRTNEDLRNSTFAQCGSGRCCQLHSRCGFTSYINNDFRGY